MCIFKKNAKCHKGQSVGLGGLGSVIGIHDVKYYIEGNKNATK